MTRRALVRAGFYEGHVGGVADERAENAVQIRVCGTQNCYLVPVLWTVNTYS